jgi:hypothetical protein
MLGVVRTEEMQRDTIEQCYRGTLDVAVATLKSGKAGCNLQGMTWMVSLGPIAISSDEEQAQGT